MNKKTILIYILISILYPKENRNSFNIKVSGKNSINVTSSYFYNSNANSQVIIDSTLYDIFEYQIISKDKNLIEVEIINESWEEIDSLSSFEVDQNFIQLSDPFIIRGTPIVSICIPLEKINNNISYLNNFELEISYKNDIKLIHIIMFQIRF